MEQLPALKRTLKEKLPTEGISYVIRTLKEYLPQESPKYNALLQLESEYREVKMKIIDGVIDDDASRRYQAELRKRLLELIDSLEAEDFDKNTRRSKLAKEQKIRTGSVLYQIPKQMQLGEESRCLVRIAFDKAMLIEDIDLDADTEFRGNVRLSDYMQVQLIDPKRGAAFTIQSTSKAIQLVDEDDFTEWRFYVTPQQAGRHLLELKVCIMYVIDGREVLREKTLEESVVIVSEPVPKPVPADFTRLPGQLVLAEPVDMVAPQSSLPAWMRGKGIALGLALLLLFSATTTYAFVPELPAYIEARYIERDPEALRQFIQEHPESALADNALWGVARIVDEPEAYIDYQEQYPDTKRARGVDEIVDRLEPKVWQAAQVQTSAPLIGRYLALYGERGRHRAEAVELLKDTTTWQASAPQNLDPAVARKTQAYYEQLAPLVRDIDNPKIERLYQAGPAAQSLVPAASEEPATSVTSPDDIPGDKKSEESTLSPPTSSRTATDPKAQPANDPAKNRQAETPAATGPAAPPATPRAEEKTTPARTTAPPPSPETSDFSATDSQDEEAILAQIAAAMVRIEGGEFTMGCQDGRDTDCFDSESPAHPVRVPTFELGKFEVTQVQWRTVMGADPEGLHNTGCNACPVEMVSWNDAQVFIKKLNELTEDNYRLPTEAEWEFAARGGRRSQGFLYSGSNDIDAVAWYRGNYANGNTFGSEQTTRPVGGKAPNELGLYDMSGNVYEWCADDWHGDYENAPKDGSAWVDSPRGTRRVIRGGSWIDPPIISRAAHRDYGSPTDRHFIVGFRLARS